MESKQSIFKGKNLVILILCIVLVAAGIFLLISLNKQQTLQQQNETLTADSAQAAADYAQASEALEALQAVTPEPTPTQAATPEPTPTQAASESADAAAVQAEFDAYKADAEQQLSDAAQQLSDAAQAQADLQAELDAYTAGTESTTAGTADAETLSALQAEYDAYKADAEQKLSAAGAEAQAAEQAQADLQAEYDAYKADAESAAEALSALQAEYDAYKAEAGQSLSDAVAAGAADVQAAKDEAAETLAALQTEYDTYKATAEANAQAAAETTAALQSDYDAYKAETAQALADAQANSDAAAELSTLQEEYAAYQASAQETEQTLQATQETLVETEETLQTTQQALAANSLPTDENGAGNQANGNLAVYYNGNIYYLNNYSDGNIYVENAAGYGDYYLRRTSSHGVNHLQNIAAIADGNLYYLNSDSLYRFKLNSNSSDAEFMKGHMDLYSDSAMTIYDDRIYFLKQLFGADGEPEANFYLVDFRCNNLENVPGVSAYAFVGDGQYVYYVESRTYNLVKYDLVSQTGETIWEADGSVINNLNLAGDTLYFSMDGELVKLNADGTGLTALGGVSATSINVIGDWVYYSNPSDGGTIYRITTDGNYNEKLCDVENTGSLSVAGEWLFFIQYDGDTVVDTYKMMLDGTGLTLAKP